MNGIQGPKITGGTEPVCLERLEWSGAHSTCAVPGCYQEKTPKLFGDGPKYTIDMCIQRPPRGVRSRLVRWMLGIGDGVDETRDETSTT